MSSLRELIDATMLHQAIDPNDPLHSIRLGRKLDSLWCDIRSVRTKPSGWTWLYFRISRETTINRRGAN